MTNPFSRPRTVDIVGWVLLALAVCFAIYVRVRLREFPLERDEGEFAYAGQLILQGVPPYKLAYNMKLPGTYIAYAALMAVFGQTTPGIHLGLLAVNLATIVLVYRFTRELFDSFSAGMAAIVYSILSVSPAFLGMAAHATHFVAFFGLAGTYILWRHLQSGRWWQAAASGLLMGIAFLMKQQGVFLMVFGGGFLLLLGLLLKTYPRRRLPLAAVLYSVGSLLPYGLICLWLWRAGVWQKFWFWTVDYASKYVQNVPVSLAFASLRQSAGGMIAANWPLALLAVTGVAGVAILGRGKPAMRTFAFGFLVFSFFCTCPGFYFRQHYFIVMLPAVAIFTGVGCRLLWDLAAGRFWAKPEQEPVRPKKQQGKQAKSNAIQHSAGAAFGPLSALVVLFLLATFAGTLWIQRDFFFNWDSLTACRRTYGLNPFLECPAIADYLQKNSTADDRIAVMGSEPEVFFDARRNSATGYIYTYGMMESQPLARQMQEEMSREIEASQPRYIVFVNIPTSWLPQNDERFIFNWLQAYLQANYRRMGVADIADDRTIYRWEGDAQNYQPRSPINMSVFQRK